MLFVLCLIVLDSFVDGVGEEGRVTLHEGEEREGMGGGGVGGATVVEILKELV